jgi:hypothetical protein
MAPLGTATTDIRASVGLREHLKPGLLGLLPGVLALAAHHPDQPIDSWAEVPFEGLKLFGCAYHEVAGEFA